MTKENQPSTCLLASGVGSNWAGTLVILEGSIELALRKASQIVSLAAWTPIFLPIMSCGVFSGLEASDMIANGLFWYMVAMIFRSAPLATASEVELGLLMPIRTLPDWTFGSMVAVGPPETRSAVMPSVL